MTVTYEIEISDITVSSRYYTFFYHITKNGEELTSGIYENDHEVDADTFKSDLENGYAIELILDKLIT